jgi:UDP-N-acetylglucosamine transferase subunit ALG13
MILVTVGTMGSPFDRLLREVDRLEGEEELIVQHGPSRLRPRRATCVDFLPFGELMQVVGEARVVVTHGGVGSILMALMNGRCPLVVPRLRRFHEAVDDHQLALARKLSESGLVTLVQDPAVLPELLSRANGFTKRRAEGAASELIAEVREFIANSLAARE